MSPLTPEIASEVKEMVLKNADEIAGALGRAFGGRFAVLPETVQTAERASVESEFHGPGLVCLFHVGGSGVLAFLSEASGLVPGWTASPDVSGISKLNTLALELGVLMLPEAFMPDDNGAARVAQFETTISQAGIPANAGVVSLVVKSGDLNGNLWLMWPVGKPSQVFASTSKEGSGATVGTASATGADSVSPRAKQKPSSETTASRLSYESMEDGLRLLPEYTRSLLKIKIPVTVTLAATKQSVSKILEIVPGSIIQFSKSCEEPLSVEVGGQEIALGETVKVGDKFGLRVTSIVMPEERFLTLRGKRDSKN